MEEIELAGWSSHRRRLSGNFHDWMLLATGGARRRRPSHGNRTV
jgi:hypothetical protein